MTKRELLAAERKRVADMDRAAAETFAQMDRVNGTPVSLDLLAPEDWMHKGGSCGFKWNGFSVVRRRG